MISKAIEYGRARGLSIQTMERMAKLEKFTDDELVDLEYLEDKIDIWVEMFAEEVE